MALLSIACFAFVPPVAFGGWVGDTMCACPGRHKKLGTAASCEEACYGTRPSTGGGNSNASPGYDYGAAQRAQQEAAAAEAERQRQQAEADRIEQERQAEEKRAKDAAFIRDRDATARTLRGGIGISASPNDSGLKGTTKIDTGLKELRRGDKAVPGVQGPQAAWKQLHCAAALSGYAFAAVKQATPDYQESSFLLAQASNALNGQSLNVECPAAPPFPDLRGRAVDMEQVREEEKKLIGRATVIVDRLKQRGVPVAVSAEPAVKEPESPNEKLRRVQRDLNKANDVKLTGKTKTEIDQQEQDRKELTKLILANERLEKGEFTSVVADTKEPAAPRPRRKSASPTQ